MQNGKLSRRVESILLPKHILLYFLHSRSLTGQGSNVISRQLLLRLCRRRRRLGRHRYNNGINNQCIAMNTSSTMHRDGGKNGDDDDGRSRKS